MYKFFKFTFLLKATSIRWSNISAISLFVLRIKFNKDYNYYGSIEIFCNLLLISEEFKPNTPIRYASININPML